jgi:poly(A) polymerase Pap1
MDRRVPEKPLHIFSRICKVVKCFAQVKGIYYFKLGYLNGISIMVMVAYVLG